MDELKGVGGTEGATLHMSSRCRTVREAGGMVGGERGWWEGWVADGWRMLLVVCGKQGRS